MLGKYDDFPTEAQGPKTKEWSPKVDIRFV